MGMENLRLTRLWYMLVRKTGESHKSEIWFWKALVIVTLTHNAHLRPGTNRCIDYNAEYCQFCSMKKVSDYVSVRDYDVLTNEKVPGNEVDQKINCIRIIWESYGK